MNVRHTAATLGLGFLVGCGGFLVGCGSEANAPEPSTTTPPSDNNQPPATDTSATEPPPPDHGAPSNKFPAFTPDVGLLVNNGGDVLESPVIVTVTWNADPNQATFEKFGDAIGGSKYWASVTSEYGVGPGISGEANHVRIADAPPAQMSDQDLQKYVADHAAEAGGWPRPATGNVVYILYLPTSTALMLSGRSACQQGVGGYHDSVKVAGKNTAYAIVPQCGKLDSVTNAASHELAEAAVDPYPKAKRAWVGFDDNHLAWEIFQQFQSENGDACEFYRDSHMTDAEVGFAVQRQWSNASAKAGHDPCVPALANPYFNVTPLDMTDDVSMDLTQYGVGKVKSKGYVVPVGETKKIPIGFYSDAPTDKWSIKLAEGGIMGTSQKGKFDMTVDLEQGQNGEKAYIEIKTNTAARAGAGIITVVSTLGNTKHYMPILIGTPPAPPAASASNE